MARCFRTSPDFCLGTSALGLAARLGQQARYKSGGLCARATSWKELRACKILDWESGKWLLLGKSRQNCSLSLCELDSAVRPFSPKSWMLG